MLKRRALVLLLVLTAVVAVAVVVATALGNAVYPPGRLWVRYGSAFELGPGETARVTSNWRTFFIRFDGADDQRCRSLCEPPSIAYVILSAGPSPDALTAKTVKMGFLDAGSELAGRLRYHELDRTVTVVDVLPRLKALETPKRLAEPKRVLLEVR
ncbi:MAG: hypothetical protein HY681_14740 [Chloroflexi bacterium]|nr:hypothetical protein [Chloroflexota bacterium]